MTAGFVRGIERHDLLEIPVHGITIDSPPEAIQAEIARLMAARRRPDALVCGSLRRRSRRSPRRRPSGWRSGATSTWR